MSATDLDLKVFLFEQLRKLLTTEPWKQTPEEIAANRELKTEERIEREESKRKEKDAKWAAAARADAEASARRLAAEAAKLEASAASLLVPASPEAAAAACCPPASFSFFSLSLVRSALVRPRAGVLLWP